MLLTYDELADRLNIKRATLYSLVSREAIPYIRIAPRIVRFDPSSIDRWLERSEANARREAS